MNQDRNGKFSLKLVQKCPVCNGDYQQGRIDILDEDERGFLAYMTCNFCASSIIVRVATLPNGLVGNAILTDLSNSEVLDYSSSGKIKSNQVLALHELVTSDGGFIEKLK
jgi:hypothetical protein